MATFFSVHVKSTTSNFASQMIALEHVTRIAENNDNENECIIYIQGQVEPITVSGAFSELVDNINNAWKV